MEPPRDAPPRRIRSFVVRAGRIGPGQVRALAELAPRFVLPFVATGPVDFAAAFGRAAPLVVEIGFGMGATTAAIATAEPERNFLGIEVHPESGQNRGPAAAADRVQGQGQRERAGTGAYHIDIPRSLAARAPERALCLPRRWAGHRS